MALVLAVGLSVSTVLYGAAGLYDDPAPWWVSTLMVVANAGPLAFRRRFPMSVAVLVADVGSVTMPVMLLLMVPYFLIVFAADDPTVLGIMSYVPFSAPIGMPMRVFLGTAAWWEPIVSLVVVLASAALVVGVGARVYENALLRTGGRVKLAEAMRR